MTLKTSEQIHRLKERLDASELLCKTACELGVSIEEQNAKLRTELASVTARLAAAEEKVKHATSFNFYGNRLLLMTNGRWVWWLKGDGYPDHDSFYFDSYQEAIAAAASAGWMQPLGEGGGE